MYPKTAIKLFSFVILGMITSSCSFHLGTTSAGSAMITNKHFASIDFAYGTARTVNVFGIGSNEKDALVLEAKRNLYLNYDLKPGQALGHMTVDFKRTVFFPVFTTKVTISAEIIDFSSQEQDIELSQSNLDRFTNKPLKSRFDFAEYVSYLHRGDTITARLLGRDRDKLVIQYFDPKNNFRIKRVWHSDLRFAPKNIQPRENSSADKLYTPQNPSRELVKFQYKGKSYTGELMEASGDTYLIRMETGSGKLIGLQIDKGNVLD